MNVPLGVDGPVFPVGCPKGQIVFRVVAIVVKLAGLVCHTKLIKHDAKSPDINFGSHPSFLN